MICTDIPFTEFLKSRHLSRLPNKLYLNKGADLSKFERKYDEVESQFSNSCFFKVSSCIQSSHQLSGSQRPIKSRIAIDASIKESKYKLNRERKFLLSLKQSFSPGPITDQKVGISRKFLAKPPANLCSIRFKS